MPLEKKDLDLIDLHFSGELKEWVLDSVKCWDRTTENQLDSLWFLFELVAGYHLEKFYDIPDEDDVLFNDYNHSYKMNDKMLLILEDLIENPSFVETIDNFQIADSFVTILKREYKIDSYAVKLFKILENGKHRHVDTFNYKSEKYALRKFNQLVESGKENFKNFKISHLGKFDFNISNIKKYKLSFDMYDFFQVKKLEELSKGELPKHYRKIDFLINTCEDIVAKNYSIKDGVLHHNSKTLDSLIQKAIENSDKVILDLFQEKIED